MIQTCDHCNKNAVVKEDLKNITLLWCVACFIESNKLLSIGQPLIKK